MWNRREKLFQRLFAYWCPVCSRRFIRKKSFEKHYFPCKEKQDLKVNERLGLIAPRNRKQRRDMAKKAGQIRDWKNLNG